MDTLVTNDYLTFGASLRNLFMLTKVRYVVIAENKRMQTEESLCTKV